MVAEYNYPSLTAFVEHVQSLPRLGPDSLEPSNIDWYGGSSELAYQLATKGWPEGAKRASEVSAKLATRLAGSTSALVTTHELVYDVCGASFDVGSYLSGEPECWLRFEPQESKRSVRIVCNIGVSSFVETEVMERRGVAMAALAIALQGAGHPVTIDVMVSIHRGNAGRQGAAEALGTHVVRVLDASTGSIVDIDRVVYATAHPTMLRRLMFDALFGQLGDCDGFLGAPMDTQPSGEKIDLYLGAAHLDYTERWQDGGEAWILAEYEKQTKAL